ncbi:MAG: hypothetical protein H7257_01485 [Taibaiella sp.]|nr:hypothetical protein [Taibaiella sp.]
MNGITAVFDKVFVKRFYKVNAGFFLTVLILAFGIMSGQETIMLHHGVMLAMNNNLAHCGIGLLVFALYGFKCLSFLLKVTDEPENTFLYELQSLPGFTLFILLARLTVSVYSPLLIYAVITAVVGFRSGHIIMPLLIAASQLLLCGGIAAVHLRRITGTWKAPIIKLPAIPGILKKGYFTYLLSFSLDSMKGTFMAVKLFSLLLLQVMVTVNEEKVSRENICILLMFLISAHALLPVHYVKFAETRLSFLRNMPMSLLRRLLLFVVTYSIIFLPELLFLLWNEHSVLPVGVILSLYATAVSQLLLYTALQYLPGITTDRYTGFVFVLFFVSMMLLAALSLWYLFIAETLVAIAIYFFRYYRYEMKADEQ